jgi:ankyrin repeat protein
MAFSLKSNNFSNVLEDRANLLNRPHSSTSSFKPSTRYTTTYVIKKGFFNLVRYLLSTGTDPNFVDEKEPYLRTSLIYSTFIKDETWSLSVAQNLLEFGASLRQTDAKLLTPFHYCCAFGRVKLLELFLGSLDFDLSKSLDSNGNSCLHYALRSHNVNIVRLVVQKLKKCHMIKVNLKNCLGLKPMDIEDEEEIKISKEANKTYLLYDGDDTLEDCKKILNEYVVYLQEKQARREQARLIAQQNEAIANAEKKKSKTKKRKGSKKQNGSKTSKEAATKTTPNKTSTARKRSTSSKAGSRTSLNHSLPDSIKEESPRIETNLFFATELEDHSVKHKPPKKSSRNALINLKIASWKTVDSNLCAQMDRTDSVLSVPRPGSHISRSRPRSLSGEKRAKKSPTPSEVIIDKEKAKILTPKSFLITLKDLLGNLIEYNSLFYAKEYMLDNSSKTRTRQRLTTEFEHRNTLKRSQSLKSKDHLTNAIMTIPSSLEKFEWKREFPEVYCQLENFLSLSFRETINPPLSKKVVNSKKLQTEIRNAIARVKQLDSSKRNTRSKIEIKSSRPSSSLRPLATPTMTHSQMFNSLNNEYTTSHFIDDESRAFILPLTNNISENLSRYQ